jgi:hypothetical protein
MSDIVPAAPSVLASFIERAARDPEFDVAKFGELLRMQREVEHDQARKAFNRAMADAQSEMLPVVRDATNDHLRNRYARLETIDAAMRPIYTRHGFSVRFGSAPSPREGDIRIICTVAHAGGYFEENHLDAPIGVTGSQGGRTATTPVQAVGSAVTYLRRYLLTMVFNIVLANEDDDGEGTRKAAAHGIARGERKVADEPPRRTVRQLLEAWEIAARDAQSAEEADRIICAPDVLQAKETFTGEAKTRLDKLIADTLAKWWHTPPDATDADDGDLEIAGEEKLAAG